MDFITIESHFGVPENAIRPDTRNICSKELVTMIYKVSEILYPNEKIEVLILPSEVGSYKDIFKVTGGISIVGILSFVGRFLNYKDNHEEHRIQMFKECLETTQRTSGLSGDNISISDEKFNELCEDHGISRSKNNRYKALEKDESVSYEETMVKNSDNLVLLQQKIERTNFSDMITHLPEDEDFEQTGVRGVIELISLVVKQKKEGKGIPRRGIYYGENIIHKGMVILEQGEEINFFMQDNDFKNKIKDQEITFANGDNITALLDLKTEIKGGLIKSLHIRIKEVIQFNEAKIEHIVKNKKIIPKNLYQNQGLFSDLDIV